MKKIESLMERGIFASRWLLLPIYLGMIAAQALYTVKFLQGLWHLWGQLLDPQIGLKVDPGEAAGSLTAAVAHAGQAAGSLTAAVAHASHADVAVSEVLFLQSVLGLVDFLMVANLIVMVVIGGYATFVSKLDLDEHADRPAWLDHIDPGTLKTKLAGALIGVSGIHLLQTFTTLGLEMKGMSDVPPVNTSLVMWQVIIHLTFVISTIILALADWMLEKKLALAHREGIEAKSA